MKGERKVIIIFKEDGQDVGFQCFTFVPDHPEGFHLKVLSVVDATDVKDRNPLSVQMSRLIEEAMRKGGFRDPE